ncbi:MAG: hypothetical protein P0Y49_18070 [Candidatus Pedobacter colombiensis]|uniref:DUF4884 domain-containing protein n=1 Tax=Candidatus Pedobacter colombiensis TaxID=3121371 RepID=A0AAJ6B5F7_9SPHI|nr:hypothetical protein [Pedobacter sp.]WEK18692.1 MAG: hypothetical protein P0Y49_18070 [Pedobacter sp.]
MKKLILLAGLAITLLSCRAMYGHEAKFTMGMSETEFKEKNKPDFVSANEGGRTIYRTMYVGTGYKFFFFKEGKLVRYENGTRPDDYLYMN